MIICKMNEDLKRKNVNIKSINSSKTALKIAETDKLFLFLIHEKKSFSICVFSISDVCPGNSETYRRNGHEIIR